MEKISVDPLRVRLSFNSFNNENELSHLQKLDNLEITINEKYSKLEELHRNATLLDMNYQYYLLKSQALEVLDLILDTSNPKLYRDDKVRIMT